MHSYHGCFSRQRSAEHGLDAAAKCPRQWDPHMPSVPGIQGQQGGGPGAGAGCVSRGRERCQGILDSLSWRRTLAFTLCWEAPHTPQEVRPLGCGVEILSQINIAKRELTGSWPREFRGMEPISCATRGRFLHSIMGHSLYSCLYAPLYWFIPSHLLSAMTLASLDLRELCSQQWDPSLSQCPNQ